MWLSGFKWMFLIIGTIIGAGYASGRELWEFFGSESGLAIVLFAILFFICCYVLMTISFQNRTEHYMPVLRELMGKRITGLYDYMIILYLFSTTIIMIAGGGATLEVLHIPYWYGVAIISLLLVLLFVWGINGMTSMNAVIIPVLIVFLVGTLFIFQWTSGFEIRFDVAAQHNWPTAFTFTALNILPLVAVLAAIGKKIKHTSEIWIASFGSALVMGVISYLYNESLLIVAHEVMLYEIPLFAILKHYPYFMVLVMSGLLWAAIYTTAASGMLGLCTRFREYVNYPFWLIALLLTFLMIPLTTIGFSTLIAILYPLYGLLNLYILGAILLYPIVHKFDERPVP
ncbi:YkvI family membrane protein [Alteribacter aurantiacus]|uniref:YkvI family membrane protein n=1 Tax=Alteribacter aurantiacus TaxID=254410 RepID=UPI00042A18F7|nr:membrane protein [Alteribacter aurantiacus]